MSEVRAKVKLNFTDNCNITSQETPDPVDSQTPPTGACKDYTFTRTWTATDACNNSTQHVITIVVKDETKPEFTTDPLPVNQTVSCLSEVRAKVKLNFTDNCNITSQETPDPVDSQTPPTGACKDYTFTRTWTATDACGNSTQHVITIVVNDEIAPSLTGGLPYGGTTGTNTCKPTESVAAGGFSAVDAIKNYTDNCGGEVKATLTKTEVSGDNCNWTVKYTFDIADACDNKVSSSYMNTGGDKTVPTLTGKPYAGTSGTNACKPTQAAADAGFSTTNAIIGYTDNCGGSVIAEFTSAVVSGDNCQWSIVYSFVVKDACGNPSSTGSYTNTGGDNTPPSLTGTSYTGQNLSACRPTQIEANAAFDATNAKLGYTDNCTSASDLVAVFKKAEVSGTGCDWSVKYTFDIRDACNKIVTGTYTNTGTSPKPTITPKAPSCPVGKGGEVSFEVSGGCSPIYEIRCSNGSKVTSSVSTIGGKIIVTAIGLANGAYSLVATDANGCSITSSAVTLNCLYPKACTYSQGAFGQPGGMINGISTYEQLKALLNMNPLLIGSGSKSLTLTTAECVDNVLPSSGTSAALSGIFTCPPFPASNSNSVYKNTLLGQCIALSLSVRLPNNELSGLKLSEICGITIPTGIKGISSSTTVSDLIAPTTGILNQALSGSKDYSKNLGTLTKLAGDIIVAYDGCRNPCITAPACATPAPIVNQSNNLERPTGGAKTINKIADFKVFPVPSDGVVNLDMEDYRDDNIEIKIFNTMSQLVYTQKIQELQQGIVSINLSDLGNGAYIISVKAESKATLSKVMIINK